MYQSLIKPDFFSYANAIATIAPNTIVTPQINFSNDSDFEFFEMRAIVWPTDQQTAPILMQMSIANGSLLSNVPIDVMSFASLQDGGILHQDLSGYPIRLPANTRIPANTTLNIQLNNTDPAETVLVQIILIGYKVEKA